MFSRVAYGARLSLSIGLIGVIISLVLGILLGGLSGYYGGTIDNIIQRIIEFLRSIPSIPLWMGLSAALPPGWPILYIYFSITIILSFIGWTGMARVVRGKFLQLREEEFVMAARFSGSNELRIILRHMLPSFLSHIIASHDAGYPNDDSEPKPHSAFLGLGTAAAGHQLGRAVAGSAEHQRRRHRSLDDGCARPHGGGRRDRIQLHGRWHARRRRPLRLPVTSVSGP